MANLLPTPLAAAIGVVPAVMEQVFRLPGRAVQLPVLAISSALSTMDALRTGYDDLAVRGERLVARLRGQAGAVVEAADELEDRVEEVVARTPFATAYDRVEDAAEATAHAVAEVAPLTGRVRKAAGSTVGTAVDAAADTAGEAAGFVTGTAEKAVDTAADVAGKTAEQAVDTAADVAGKAAETAEKAVDTAVQDTRPEAESPKGTPTPKAVEPDSTRVGTAASPTVVQAVEQATASVPSAAPVDHDELPLPDYDHMTLGSLRGRLRALSVAQLVQIRTYEKAHADRLPVVTMLDNRIAKLSTDPAARPR